MCSFFHAGQICQENHLILTAPDINMECSQWFQEASGYLLLLQEETGRLETAYLNIFPV